jgi:pyruvate,water dikinase
MIVYPAKHTSRYTIGGKAKGLLQLIGSGLTVPVFLVLPAETFDAIIQQGEDIQLIRRQLLHMRLPEQENNELHEILSAWKFKEHGVIVRSSIADEDGVNDAFAGIMDSFANLTTYEDVTEAIGKCAASAYSEKAIAYRKQKGLTLLARPAIIIQQQIEADVSGVIFSTYPQYPQEMAIHAVWGLGEGLVNGELEADEFYVLKKSGMINRKEIARKHKQVATHNNGGTHTIQVSEDKQEMPCLTENQLHQLFTAASSLEQRFNHPQDIEFVIAKDVLYFVQSRPITQTIPEVVVYDNSNIQESYCGVTTPLTFSFAQRAYAIVYRQTMTILSLDKKTIEAYEPVVNNLLGLIKGRIYYNINNWYRGLQLLPSFKQNKEDMERMMGVEEPVDFIADTEKTFIQKLKLLPSLVANLLRIFTAFSRLKTSTIEFHRHFQQQYAEFYRVLPLVNNNAAEIIHQKKKLDDELLQNWTTPIINDFYVMMMNGRVRRRLIKAGIENTDEFLSRYLSGNQQIESALPAVAMQQLAGKAAQQLSLKELIINLSDDVHENVQQQFPGFYSEVESFISSYGDRTVGELKLETITMRLSPKIFYSYLRNYLFTSEPLQTAPSHLHHSAKTELESKMQNSGPRIRRKMFNSLLKLKEGIQYREAMRLERTRLFGMYRALYLSAGHLLFKHGILQSPRDVFYLTETEIETLLQQETADETIKRVEERKATFEAYKAEDVAARVVIPSPPTNHPITKSDDGTLHGTGCVPGNVTSTIIVIKSPEDDLDVRGKIVCALRTDPGWVALFPSCKGVLIEKGSALSHSVILLREFGIPAIINIEGLTKKLSGGETVTMDGTTGQIKIVANETGL